MLIGCVKPATIFPSSPEPLTSAPPPRYEHPPPYSVSWSPGRGGLNDVLIHRLPDPSITAAQREYLRARSTPSNSSTVHIILACLVFWLCGVVFGTVAFILAGLYIHLGPLCYWFLPRDALVHSAVLRLLSSVCPSVCNVQVP